MKYIIFIVVAIIIIWAAMVYRPGQVAQVPVGGADQQALATSNPAISNTSNAPINTTMQNGLKIEDIKVGTGAEAKTGDLVTVNYTGTLTNGTKFDSSLNPGREPFVFPLGQGQVIKGWDLGVPGMKIGGIRKLTIPASLGYGSSGAGAAIPPNATLIFQVELLAVRTN